MNMHVSICAAGVDVGRDFLDLAIAPAGFSRRFANTDEGARKLLERLRQHGVARVVIEAIGPYALRLVRAVRASGVELGIVEPRRIKSWRIAEGRRAKNDRLDAQAMARFALQMPDVFRPVPDEETMKIRALSARRRQLVEMAAMEKTRLKQAFDEDIAQSHRDTIERLEAERDAIEARLDAALRAAGHAESLRLLQTAPGVGPAVSRTLVADLPELGKLERGPIASLAGVAPHIAQSGASAGRAMIGGGRPCVRAALYMAALSAVRSDARFKAEYQAMRASGKPSKVALVAIARKLVVGLNSVMRNKRPWQQNPARPGSAG